MRPEKPSIVESLQTSISGSSFVILIEYTRMNVMHFTELRNRLGSVQSSVIVAKNSFLNRALKNSALPDLSEYLHHQTAFIIGSQEICVVAKILKAFSAEFEKPKILAGILDNQILTSDDLIELALLPSQDILQAQFLSLLNTPSQQLLRTLKEPSCQFVRLLDAFQKIKEIQ